MPYSDPKRRAKLAKDWREKQTPAYSRWLYQRRRLRFWIAESGRALLGEVASGRRGMGKKASDWVAEVERRELEVGTRFDHETQTPYNPS